MMKRLNALIESVRGTVTIELALAAPMMAATLIGLVDLSTAYSTKLRMEQIAQRTIERVQATGFKTSDEATLEAEAVAAATALGYTGATANLTFWVQCDTEKQTNYTDTCDATEATSRYAELDITYSFAPIIAHKFTKSNSDGTLTVHGIAGLRVQ